MVFLVASEGEAVASHQGYHVQYVEPEIYATQTNGGQAQMYVNLFESGDWLLQICGSNQLNPRKYF